MEILGNGDIFLKISYCGIERMSKILLGNMFVGIIGLNGTGALAARDFRASTLWMKYPSYVSFISRTLSSCSST